MACMFRTLYVACWLYKANADTRIFRYSTSQVLFIVQFTLTTLSSSSLSSNIATILGTNNVTDHKCGHVALPKLRRPAESVKKKYTPMFVYSKTAFSLSYRNGKSLSCQLFLHGVSDVAVH